MQTLPGFRDFYPADCAARNHVFATWREVARRYSFVEYDGPTLEPVELYKKKSGGELVGQLFDFVDKGERHVALRPEMTPTLARMVAAREREFKKPLKWFSIAPFFRYEKQQKGRLREFTQLNCDLIGESSPAADAEMIALAVDLMRGFGLRAGDFVVRVNDRNVWMQFLAARGIAADRAPEFLQIVDKLEREAPLRTAVRLSNEFGVSLDEVNKFLARPPAELGGALGPLEADLAARGLRDFVEFDPKIVRGLAYYTGVVFEVFDRQKKFRALAGGGRYDGLIATLSDNAVDLPALGFAVGDVVLLELLRSLPHTAVALDAARAANAPQVYAIIADENFRAKALSDIQQLRSAGIRVDYSLTPRNFRNQIRAAADLEAEYAVIYDGLWPRRKYKVMDQRKSTGSDLEPYCDTFEELLDVLRPDPAVITAINYAFDEAIKKTDQN